MVNVYLSGQDARNAAADLWQQDQLQRVNDQYAPPPQPASEPAQAPPPAPVEAAGGQGSSLPPSPAVGPARATPVPPAAVTPNPTPDRNDIADQWQRGAIADAWEKNALSDVYKGVSQAGQGVQTALSQVPQQAQGLTSNLSALPGAQPTPPAQPTPGAIAGPTAPVTAPLQAPAPQAGGDLQTYARQAAQRNGVDPDIFQRQIQQESGFNPGAQSPAGAQGIAQFMPATAQGMGVDPSDPYASLDGAARLMKQNLDRYGGDYSRALAAYNAGPGNVDKYGGVPPFAETQTYIKNILGGVGQAATNIGQQLASTVQPIAKSAEDWLAIAKEQLGKPYIWGSAGGRSTFDPNAPGFDCSGFVAYVMKKAFGVDLPAFTGSAYTATRPLDQGETPGAAGQVAFYNMGQSDPHLQHIALSIGNGQVIQAGGRRNDVNTDVANDIGTPEWRVPVGIPDAMAQAAQQVVGAGVQAAQQVGQNAQQAVQQTAQGLINTVGNLGQGIGSAWQQAGQQNAANPMMQNMIASSGPSAINPGMQGLGGAIAGGVSALGQTGVAQTAGQIGSALGLQNPLDAAQAYSQVEQKYGGGLQPKPGGGVAYRVPDYSNITPEDQQVLTNAAMAVGGITQPPTPEGAPRVPTRGLPPNEPLATGPQPGQLGFGTELPLGGPVPVGAEALGPAGPQRGQMQIGGQLPYGGPAPVGGEVIGPAGPQPGQFQLGSELPYGGPRPPGTEPLAPGAQPGQFQFGSELPLGGPRPPGTEPQGPAGGEFYRPSGAPTSPYPVAQQPALPGVQPPSAPVNPATPWDIIRTSRIGALAGGIPTVTHIALNTPLQAGWKLFSNTAQDIVERHPETIPMQFVGAWQGLRNWAMNVSQLAKAPGPLAESMGGGAGAQALETGLLGLVKTHPILQDLAGQVGASMELWRSAAKQATDSGLSRLSPEWQAEVQRLVSNPTPEIQAAVDRAQNTFSLRGAMGFQGQKVADWLQNNELGRFVMPFFNIGYHVATQGIERSPAGFIGTAYDVARSRFGAGPYAAGATNAAVTPLAERFTNNLVGTGLFMEAYSQASQGNITGNGPDDPKQRAELMSQGWMPNSTLIGGRWVDNHVLGPMGWALGEAANLAEARGDTPYTRGTKQATQQDGMQQAASYLTRMGTYLQDETFLRSFGQLLQAAGSGAQAGRMGESVLASMAGSLVPQGGLIANVASAADPYARRAQPGDIAQSLMTRFPGLREQVPARLTGAGEPEQNPQYGAGVLLPRSGTGQPSPILGLLSGAGITLPTTPPQNISYSGRQLTLSPDEQQLRQQTLGQRLQQTMQSYLGSIQFQQLPPGQQKRALEPLVRAAEQYADQRVIAAMAPDDRKARLAAAPRTGAYAPVYPTAGAGLAGMVAQESTAARQRQLQADAARQQMITGTRLRS